MIISVISIISNQLARAKLLADINGVLDPLSHTATGSLREVSKLSKVFPSLLAYLNSESKAWNLSVRFRAAT